LKEASRNAADAGGVVGPDVVAACALASVPGLGASGLARLTHAFGSFAEALDAGPKTLLGRADELRLRPETRDFLSRKPDLEELGIWAVDAARAAGARIVVLGDPWYPSLLRQIENPPPVLYVRGGLAAEMKRVALVGARAADDYGLQLARTLGEELAMAGVQVISGGALGIDAAAHAGALWGQGTSVAVLGSGIDMPYPKENEALFERLSTGGGAVVSEFPPGTASNRSNFPRRNRTIAGLSHATVVIRATEQSGALITANHAAVQGRPIFAVPGQAGDELSAGPNHLLTAGAARAVTSARDILQLLQWPVPGRLGTEEVDAPHRKRPTVLPPPEPRAARADPQVLDELALRLWHLLDDRRPLHVDELAARSQLPAHEALRKLTELELKGLCLQKPGKYFLRR